MVPQQTRADKWKERHRGALGASEVGLCLHCAGARIADRPETNPFSPQKRRRMKIGQHFQGLERERLKEKVGEEFESWYAGRVVRLEGLAIPVRAQPDFVLVEDGRYRIIEVKYRTFPPPELPKEWAYQAGVYSLRYESCPVTYAVYDLEERMEFESLHPPGDLPALLREWTEALAGVLAGHYQPEELPHEPYWCARSEWACADCIGQRTTESDLTDLEAARFGEYVQLRLRHDGGRQFEKEYEAAQEAAREILAAHGGSITRRGLLYRLAESRFDRLDEKAIPPDEKEKLPKMEVTMRRILIEKEAT